MICETEIVLMGNWKQWKLKTELVKWLNTSMLTSLQGPPL